MAAPMEIGLMLGYVGNEMEERFGRLRQLGVRCCQIAFSRAGLTREIEKRINAITLRDGYEITTVFCGFDGERYDDIPTVRATIGLVPESTRAKRLNEMKKIADATRRLGAPAIALHIGYVPPRRDRSYRPVVKAAQEIADYAAGLGLKLTLETGQETARHLKEFIQDVGRANLGVNFDPANMLLYGNDQPLKAVPILGPYLFNVHAKDGNWPTVPNQLGHESPIGQGQVNFPEFIRKLKAAGFRGPLIIEREISGPQQIADMRTAISYLRELVQA